MKPDEIILPPGESARVRKAAEYLRRRLPHVPRLGIVLGSGQGDVDLGPAEVELPCVRIPELPRPRVKGHEGTLQLCGPALVFRGRVHLYEGRPVEDVVRAVRVLAALGAEGVILANAAGGLNPKLKPGDLMLVSDHLNLLGTNPLAGGPNFMGMTGLYDAALRARLGAFKLREGVYAAVPGPTYETPAEVRMLRRLGADAVGMSTVPEAMAAHAAGLRVLALSVITNRAGAAALSHREVLEVSAQASERLGSVLRFLSAEACKDPRPAGRPQ